MWSGKTFPSPWRARHYWRLKPSKGAWDGRFKWISSNGSDFNYKCVSFKPEEVASGTVYYNYENRSGNFLSEDMLGTSVFYKDQSGNPFHAYSAYARAGEAYLSSLCTHRSDSERSRVIRYDFSLTDWACQHGRYDASGFVDPTGRYREAAVRDLIEAAR